MFAGQDHAGGELADREPGHHGGAGPPLPRVRPRNAPPGLRRPQEPLHRRYPPFRRARVRRAPHRRGRWHRCPTPVRGLHLLFQRHLRRPPPPRTSVFNCPVVLTREICVPAGRGSTGLPSSSPHAPTFTTSGSSSPGGRRTRRRRRCRSSTSCSGSSPTRGNYSTRNVACIDCKATHCAMTF